jgi:serine/threonine-protein kinase
MLEPGQLVDGRFEVESLLGEGGLAAVYRVRHTDLGSVHALKLLSWRKKSLNERLLLEGRIQAQLNHPNIVAVTDLVRHDGQLGLLMEFVDHASLEEYLSAQGGLGLERGLELLAPVLSAVAAAHAVGVTHRDLKPANILLQRTARGLVPKVTDFGIAKVVADIAGHSTAVGSTMGTPGYLAPEQMEDSSQIDARADVFALGAIGWELITGRRAFADEQGALTVMSTTKREVPPLSDFVDCPRHVEEALATAMAKRPDDRFADCASFARAVFAEHPHLLDAALGRTTTAALSLAGLGDTLQRQPQPTLLPPLPVQEEAVPETTASTEPSVPLGARVIGVVVVIGLLMTGAGLVGLLNTPDPDPRPLGTLSVTPAPPATPDPEPRVPSPPPVAPTEAPVAPASDDAVAAVEPVVPVETRPIGVPPPSAVPTPAQPATTEVPAPTPDPDPDPAPDPEPAAPVPAAVAPIDPPPPPEPIVAPDPPPDVSGKWVGKAANLRLELQLTSTAAGALEGRASFTNPPRPRDLALTGTVSADGRIRFMAGDLRFQGVVAEGRMSGTYRPEGSDKDIPWNVSAR